MEAHPKAKARAVRNTAGTFAGRRPPANLEKLEVFMKMKELYYETRPDQQEGPSKKRKGSTNQNQYYAFMQKEMAKLASAGVNGGERMKRAAKILLKVFLLKVFLMNLDLLLMVLGLWWKALLLSRQICSSKRL